MGQHRPLFETQAIRKNDNGACDIELDHRQITTKIYVLQKQQKLSDGQQQPQQK